MLERESALEQRAARAGALLAGSRGEDGSYGVSVEELPARLVDVVDLEATAVEAERLAAACGLPREGERRFTYDQLASESFETELQRIISEVRQARAIRQEQERAASQAASAAQSEGSSGEAEAPAVDENDDRGTNSRILASLAYLLPLIDSLQFGIFLVQVAPFLGPIFAILAIPGLIVNAVPFGSLLLFIAWVILGSNRDLPRLVRFNLQQAVLLDVSFFLPNLLVAAASGGSLPPAIAGFFFLNLMVVITYCILRNSDGEFPDGIPLLSDAAKRLMEPSLSLKDSDTPRG